MAGNQISDRRTVAIPGPTGSVTPEVKALRDQAVSAATAAADSAGAAAVSASNAAAATQNIVPVQGETAEAATARINDALAHGSVTLRGVFTISRPLVIPSGTTLDARGATINRSSGGFNLVTNLAVSQSSTRDTGITILGGVWNHGAASGSGTNLHGLLFRRVDGITIRDVTVNSTSGKYAINLGDVTKFLVENVTFSTASDGVHVNGPASAGTIRGVRGTTGDDSVALTGNDYAAYADVIGDITDILIQDVNTVSAANLVKALAGKDCALDNVTIDHVVGTHSQHGVWVGDDNGDAATKNGTYGQVTVRDVQTVGGASSSNCVDTNLANGCRRLVLEGIRLTSGPGRYAIRVGNGATIGQIVVSRGEVDGLSGVSLIRFEGGALSVVQHLVLDHCVMRTVGGGANRLINAATQQFDGIDIVSPHLSADDTSTTDWVISAASAPMPSLSIVGGMISGGKDILNGSSACNMSIDGGTVIAGVNRIGNLYNAAFTISFGAVSVQSAINQLFNVDSTCTGVTLRGTASTYLGAPLVSWASGAGAPVRVIELPIDLSLAHVVSQAGDVLSNTNASLSCGAGRVISDGGTWHNLATGATYSR